MWSLESLAILKCESRTSLHAVQHNWERGLFWCFILIIFIINIIINIIFDVLFLSPVDKFAEIVSPVQR